MGRIYSVSFENVAVTAAQDLFQIEAQTISLKLMGIFISQTSDMGDAASEGLLIRVRKEITNAIANSATEVRANNRDAAALANLNVNQTAILATGALTWHAEGWNILTPFIFMPIPELFATLEPGEAGTINIEAPNDALTMHGTLYFEEN